MALHCPHCRERVYSRRNPLCSVCGHALPADVVYSPEALEAVEAEERERDRQKQLHDERRWVEYEARLRQGSSEGPGMM